MVGYTDQEVTFSPIVFIVTFDILTGRSMANGKALSRVITNELLHC